MTVTTTFRGTSSLTNPETPKIYNVSVPLANTEVSQALSVDTKKFMIRARGSTKMKLAFISGQSGTNYITIPAGCTFSEDSINFNGTLYFQCNDASQTVEILEWT